MRLICESLRYFGYFVVLASFPFSSRTNNNGYARFSGDHKFVIGNVNVAYYLNNILLTGVKRSHFLSFWGHGGLMFSVLDSTLSNTGFS